MTCNKMCVQHRSAKGDVLPLMRQPQLNADTKLDMNNLQPESAKANTCLRANPWLEGVSQVGGSSLQLRQEIT